MNQEPSTSKSCLSLRFSVVLIENPTDLHRVPQHVVSVESSSLLHQCTFRDSLVYRDNSLTS